MLLRVPGEEAVFQLPRSIRRSNRLWISILATLAVAFWAGIAWAQQPPDSLPFYWPNQAFDTHGIDNVNLYNGDTGVSVPLGLAYTLGPTGYQYQLMAFQTVKFWHFSTYQCGSTVGQFAWIAGDATIGAGWTLQPGYVIKRTPPTGAAYWQYVDPTGGAHQVDLSTATSAVTSDGSHLRITRIPSTGTPTSYTVEFPDGTIQMFDHIHSVPSTTDFNNFDYLEPANQRYGLHTIKDRFTNTLVTVNWTDGTHPAEFSSITLNPLSSTISFTWQNVSAGSITYRGLDYVTFPAPGGKQLKVDFGYTAATFNRNGFDNSGITSCTTSPATVSVPELASIGLSDPGTTPSILSVSYAFTYWGNPTGSAQYQGAVKQVTLPTAGTISYVYDQTATPPCVLTHPICNPTGLVADLVENPQPPATAYWDDSPAVVTRTEYDPFANQSGVTTYARSQYEAGDEGGNPIPSEIFRRVTVVPQSGFARRHYFKVDDPSGFNPRAASGIELDRRYYSGSTPSAATNFRSMIFCYGGLCGYQNSEGDINDFDFTGSNGRTPPNAAVTWYGAPPIPPAGDGGACPTASAPACTASTSVLTSYNADAGQYDTTEYKSSLPGGVDRTVDIAWAPSTATGHWILGIFTHRYIWDGGGSAPPAGTSDGATVVREDFTFDANGFLKSARTWDSVLDKVIKRCSYRNSTTGVPTSSFSQTYSSSSEPTTDPCPGAMPTVGTDGDTFGQSFTSGTTSLLPTQANWVNGTSSIGWNSYDVVRDGSTGFVTAVNDPNSSVTTTYTYDALGRVVQIQPPGGSTVEWPTTFCYAPKASGALVIVKKITASPVLDPADPSGICKADEGAPGPGSGPILGEQFDGFGRLVRDLRRNNKALTGGSYFDTRNTQYDMAGRITFSSDWQPCGTASGATSINSCAVVLSTTQGPGTLYFAFDPLGRVAQYGHINGTNVASDVILDRTDNRVSPAIAYSDSYQKSNTFCVNSTWSGSMCPGGLGGTTNGVVAATELDALGRTTKVTEPDPVSGALSSDVSNYGYNVLDELTSVDEGSADRTFSYSAFGFLTSAKTPEDGCSGAAWPNCVSVGNGTASYSLYGSLGNLRKKTDGKPALTTYNYSYDAAGRLTSLTSGSSSPFIEFIINCYDGTGACGDSQSTFSNFAGGRFPKGRLTRRIGINQIPFDAAPVFDDFTYGDLTGLLCPTADLTGKLCAQTTSIGARGVFPAPPTDLTKNGFGVPVTQKWTFNTLGATSTHALPRPSGSATTLTVNDGANGGVYTSGFLTNVTATRNGGTTQQIVAANYHESGRLSDYTTGSSTPHVKTTIAADSVVPSRPASITSVNSPGGATLFQTGLYKYDGLDSVKQAGSDAFSYDGRSRITSASLSGAGSQGYTFDRNGNLTSKTGTNAATLTTDASSNHLATSIAVYDDRGNVSTFTGATGTVTMIHDLLNRQYRTVDPSGTDFTYLYDGGGERVAKFPTKGGATRREFARLIIEARGDGSLSCTPNPFTDVTCSANPNDGKYIQKMKDVGITAGCGGGNYCPESQTQRDQSSVFFLKGEHCPVNVTGCTYTPPSCTSTIFADVPCPSQYADWVNQLYAEGITAGCGSGNFCPTDALGSWQTLAWAQKVWPSYNPLPRASIVTYRDEGGRVVTEGVESGGADLSAVEAYQRDNIFLGGQLVSSGVWSGSGWTTLNYQFYAVDHLGSTRLVTDVTAASVQGLKYWPYGDDAPGSGSDAGQRLKFAGMERDTENKHYFDHARTEDFNLGRFISADEIFGGQNAPQSWNRYSYVMNRPMSLLDRFGFDTHPAGCWTDWGPTGDTPTTQCPTIPAPSAPSPWQIIWQMIFANPGGAAGGIAGHYGAGGHGATSIASAPHTQAPCKGLGVTYSLGAEAEAGVGPAGLGGQAGGGVGVFLGNGNASLGGYVSAGGFAGGPGFGPSYPHQGYSNLAWGAFAGGGPSISITNSGAATSLSGPFDTTGYNLALGGASVSMQIAVDPVSGIWVVGLGVKGGFGLGFSTYSYQTTTKTTNILGGC